MSGMSIKKKMNLKQVFSYSAGNFGLNLFFISVSTYLLYFYTDTFGMSPAAAGTLIFSAKLINIIVNPLIGVLVDRTRGRWGKFRPYLLFGSVPLAVIGVMMFTVPDLGPAGKVIYGYVTYFLFNIFYSLVNVPYSSTLAAMSDDYLVRSRISSIKVFVGQFGGLIVSSATLPLIHMFDTEARGFTVVYALYAAVLVLMLFVTFWGTKGVGHQAEHVNTPQKTEQLTLINQLKTVALNKYLFLLLLFILVFQVAQATSNGTALFFFKYNLNAADLFSVYSLITFSILLIGIVLNPLLVKRVGKRNVGLISLAIVATGYTLFYFLGSSAELVFIFGGLSYLGFGLMAPLPWSMIPDTIEYGQWKTGLRAEGTIYSTFIFVQLLATALSAKLSGSILSAYGVWGDVPESQMVEQMWPGGIQPQCAAPIFVPINSGLPGIDPMKEGSFWEKTAIMLHSATQGASITYTTEDGENARWKLYTGPLILMEEQNTIRAKAVRIGYKDSEEVSGSFTIHQHFGAGDIN